jgi:uncharacterized alkaline shock family protein YloU
MEVIKNEIGSYTISDKAFQDIAAICCNGIKNIYPTKKDSEFVSCKFNKNGDLLLDISIRVKQGVDIVKLCNKIQDEINESILLMTGVECKKINIDIQGFETKK